VKTHPLLAAALVTQLVICTFAQQAPRPPLERPPSPLPTPPPRQQQPQAQKPDEDEVVRITTNLVQVDAIITDRDGKRVTDLKPEEVEISEDGKVQKITNFSYVVTEALAGKTNAAGTAKDKNAPPIPSARLRPEDIRRTIAVVVDDLGLSFESTHFVRSALKKFVDEQMQPGDLVAIIRTSGGMGALQQFTSDKRQLYAAIERVRWYGNGRGLVGAFAPLTGGDTSGVMPGSGSDPTAIPEDLDRFREDVLSVGTLGAVSYVVKGLRELPGKKSVLLVSEGFRLINTRDLGRSGGRVVDSLRALTDQANRSSVTIYTMDARGLQTLGLTAADNTGGMRPDQVARAISNRATTFSESQDGLIVLAQGTGGLSIRNNNDLSGGIKRVLEDQRGYYLIGYRPDQSTFDLKTGRRQFHRLSLKVTRPGKFVVRMRNGFIGVTDEETRPPQTPVQKMIGALVSPFGSSGVHLQLTTLFMNDAKTGTVMRSLLHIDARDLTFTDEPDNWHKSVFDVIAVTFGDNGVPIDQVSRSHTVRVRGETYKSVLRDGFVYALIVPVKKPGAYQLRTALRDNETDRIGSASQFVDIPDLKKDRVALSSIVLSGVTAAEYKRATLPAGQSANDTSSSAPSPANPGAAQSEGVEEGDAQAGPAVRHFRQGLVLQYGYLIFNAGVDKTTRQPQLITQVRLVRDGQVVFTGKELPFSTAGQTDLKRLTVGGALQIGSELAPGEYALQVIVSDLSAKEKYRTATQWIDFEIVK